MNIIPLTLVVSLGLALLFITLFARELTRRRFSSAERESLLPLADETPQTTRGREPDRTGTSSSAARDDNL